MSLGVLRKVPRRQLGPAMIISLCQKRFVDHASNEGISAYFGRQLASLSGSNNAVLPPSFSFQVYVTYGPTLADTPSSLAQDFVKRVMAVMNNNGQYDYPIRFDFHSLPGKGVDEIIQRYRAEGKAEPDYSKRPDDDYRGVAIALSKESWEREGADLILFDPPAKYLQTTGEERDAILGKGVGANGVLVLYGMSVQPEEINGLSAMLMNLAENNRRWCDLKDQYNEAVDQER